MILPVRDAEPTLDEAIRSIAAQTLTDWEIVAVDDGSTDGSAKILERWAGADPRIRVIRTGARGIVPALETARASAHGAVIARMDADDVAHPERLETQLEMLERDPELALCGTHVRYFPEELVRDGARRYESWLNSLTTPADLIRDLWVECPLAHPTFAMRASALERVGGYRERSWPEDYDLVLRFWKARLPLGVVGRPLLQWREGPDRLSRQDDRYGPEAFSNAKLHFLRATLLRRRDGLVIWGAGPIGKGFGALAIREGVPVRAFVDVDPKKIGQTIHGAPVVPPDSVRGFRDSLLLGAVAGPTARWQIRRFLAERGWREGRDFVAVA